ncbi:MAG: hypothetical protein JWN99_74 [Ilumatobacteraceae bacterium]|nr:hypothetical protein [Ilumatobacteraceae bacterium]
MSSRITRSIARWVALSCLIGLFASVTPVRADGWDYVYGDPGPANYSRYQAVKLSPDGSTYIAGFYSGTFSGLSSPDAYRYFLQHVNVDGTVAWTREINTASLNPNNIPEAPYLVADGLGNAILEFDTSWYAYSSVGTLLGASTIGVQPDGTAGTPQPVPAQDGGAVAVLQPDNVARFSLQHLRADLSLQWSYDLTGLVDPTKSCSPVCVGPAVVAVSDGTFWVVGQKNRVLVTQQNATSMVHISATGQKITSVLYNGIIPAIPGAARTPLVAASDSFLWIYERTGDTVSSPVQLMAFATSDGHQLGPVSTQLPADDITTSHGVVDCGGLDFSGERSEQATGPASGVLKRRVLLNGTRLVVIAGCSAAHAMTSSAVVLLSYSMNSALGVGYSLTAARELSTSSTVYAMDADGAGNAVIVGSTTDGVVYSGPIARTPVRTEVAGNEQAVAARNPLGNLNNVRTTTPNGGGSGSSTAEYTGLTPVRLFDTRPTEANGAVPVAKAKIGGATILTVKVAGNVGVPASGAGAVSLNVTVVDPDGSGYLTVYPCGTPPTASNLNFTAGQTVANAVIAPLSANGEICFASNAATHVLADVNGWFRAGLGFTAVTPLRIFDTRPGSPQGAVPVEQHPYGGAAELKVKVEGVGGVPLTNVGAVSLNVTAVGPDGPGFVTVYPCGTRPNASNLNFVAGQIVPNAVIAPVSANGEICLYSSVNTHLLADVNGWFAVGSSFHALTPVRLVDTRPSEVQGAVTVVKQKYGPSTLLRFTIAGAGGVPATGVSAVALNVTVVDPDGGGFVTAFPCGERPLASNVNFTAAQTVPNAVLVPVSAGGEVCFFSNTAAHILVDVNGWISAT